jgi:hypothetical protein
MKGWTMPRASTFVFLLAALGLYAIGLATPAQCALLLAMGCELMVWKRILDERREARVRAPVRRTRGVRGRRY